MSERAIRVWSLFLTKNPKQKTQLFRVVEHYRQGHARTKKGAWAEVKRWL